MVSLSQVKNKAASRGLQDHCVSWICDTYWFMGLCVFDLHPFCCLFIVYDVFVFKTAPNLCYWTSSGFSHGFLIWHIVCSCNTFPPLEKLFALRLCFPCYLLYTILLQELDILLTSLFYTEPEKLEVEHNRADNSLCLIQLLDPLYVDSAVTTSTVSMKMIQQRRHNAHLYISHEDK